jgi:hypothetical protein
MLKGGNKPMSGSNKRRRPWRTVLAGLGLLVVLGATGCQVDVGGQTLPSPYYMQDDVQYFQPGPEFKLAREAAALKAAQQEEQLRRR